MLVDDNAIVRSMVRQLFETEEDFVIAGEAENGQEAIEMADNLRPDLVILDLAMPVMNGLDAPDLFCLPWSKVRNWQGSRARLESMRSWPRKMPTNLFRKLAGC